MGKKKGLTLKQRRFVDEYLIDLNATQAAIRAGYSAKNADKIGPELLGKTWVSASIGQAIQKREKRAHIRQDDVLNEIALLALSNIKHYAIDDLGNVQLTEGAPDSAYKAISSVKKKITRTSTDDGERVYIETEYRLWDKPAALRMAGQHLGLFVEKIAHTDPTGTKEYGAGGLTEEERAERIAAFIERARTRSS